jgi:hypothetical protein
VRTTTNQKMQRRANSPNEGRRQVDNVVDKVGDEEEANAGPV